MREILDLLGDPVPENFGGRGRPAHIPTGENRLKVRMLLAFEWTVPRIARSLRITQPTLRKHYFSELRHADEARDALEAEMLSTTFERAKAGDASMMRLAQKMFDKHDMARLGLSPAKPGKGPRLGKKDAARLAAQSPGTGTTMGDLMAQRADHLGKTGKPN